MRALTREELLETFVEIDEVNEDDFLKIRETLTRIGIPSKKKFKMGEEDRPTLWQSCHILHKRGRYFIVHFKQLFLLDGRTEKTEFTDEDMQRTLVVADLLNRWGLVKLKNKVQTNPEMRVFVLPFKDKDNWELRSKYSIGEKRNYREE